MITKEETIKLLNQGYDIHICDGETRTITIGDIFNKKDLPVTVFDDLYNNGKGVLKWHGGVGTRRGIESCFSLKDKKQ